MAATEWAWRVLSAGILFSIAACQPMADVPFSQNEFTGSAEGAKSFQDDVEFLERHMELVILRRTDSRAEVAVAPRWQGRVMTSTADADSGIGYGWINEALIASGELQAHINAVGGEDRFWLGPEGGQFSIFFKSGDPFDLEHWQTPPALDTSPYEVTMRDDSQVVFIHRVTLTNYSDIQFEVRIDRAVRLVEPNSLGVVIPPSVQSVAYESENTITNVGSQAWTPDTGLLSVWILGMFKHSPKTVVIIPFRAGPENDLGPIVNDTYFGKVPDDRLTIRDTVLFFRADGAYRSKIGLSPQRSKPVLGSYDATRQLLTVVRYDLPEGATDYVNSMWELQDAPYAGDAVNSYNDGPPTPGVPALGPFYELETSSPAAALTPGQSLTHRHQTYHFEGTEASLDQIVHETFGVNLNAIVTAFP